MKALHGITIVGVEAWVWATITGGNGTPLGRVDNLNVSHLTLRERGTPPPMITPGEENQYTRRDNRAYWTPWQGWNLAPQTAEQVLTPLCGRIKSKSRWPNLQFAHAGRYYTPIECPNCLRIAADQGITPNYMNMLQEKDPWNTQDWQARITNPDPVTGM